MSEPERLHSVGLHRPGFRVLGLGVEGCNLEIQTTHDHQTKVARRIPRYEELLKGL